MEPLHRVPIRKVGTTENLVMGAPRVPLFILSAGCAAIAASNKFWLVVYAVLLWWGGHRVLVRLAKYDPHVLTVMTRWRWKLGKPYYPPRATPFRKNSPAQKERYKA